MGKEWLTSKEAARRLGVSSATLYAYVSRGLLRSEGSNGQRERHYSADDVAGLLGDVDPWLVDAYDADTGERKWRFYTVPGPGEPGHETWEGDSWKVGGAPAWNIGTYDPATNQIFWPTGNPSPSNRGEGREGDRADVDVAERPVREG